MSDEQRTIETIITCIADCRIGMKVRHTMIVGKSHGVGVGEIMGIDSDGVHVHYQLASVDGIYDDTWFRNAAAILKHLAAADGEKDALNPARSPSPQIT